MREESHPTPFALRACAMIAMTALAFAALSAANTSTASADILVGADLSGGARLGEVSTDSIGLGANLRVGWQEDFIPILRLAAELQFNYMGFAISNLDTSSGMSVASSANERAISGRGGARLGIDIAGFSPMLYGHIGYGTVSTKGDEVDLSERGLSFDAGLALDFTLLPLVNLGLHGGYNALLPSSDPAADPINWIDFGLHVEVAF